ncbi:MAG: sigma-70 family RNA polymerase sigma factor [Asticcacaulis sp.]
MSSQAQATLLYKAHRNALIDYANSIVHDRARAEDIVQDAWLRFDRALTRTAVQEPLQYLYRVVRNLAFDRRRHALSDVIRSGTDISEIANNLASDLPSPEERVIARNELEFIQAALRELPDRTRIAVEMHRFGGHTLTEIARQLNVSVGTAHGLVAEGLKHCHRRRRGL